VSDPTGDHDAGSIVTDLCLATFHGDRVVMSDPIGRVDTPCDGSPGMAQSHTRDVIAMLRAAADEIETGIAAEHPRVGDVWTDRENEPPSLVTALREVGWDSGFPYLIKGSDDRWFWSYCWPATSPDGGLKAFDSFTSAVASSVTSGASYIRLVFHAVMDPEDDRS
jgi:hypothetical protein